MKVRLTILCENSVRSQAGLVGEHGFACLVETPQGSYLFDTGQGLGIRRNARILGKDLCLLKAIALSHGHYDHAGGLPEVLHLCGPIDVFAHPDLFVERYRATGKLQRFIGIPWRRPYLESLGARFRLGSEPVEVGPGVWLSGEIPRTRFGMEDPQMSAITPSGRRQSPDPIADDLSLVVDSEQGLIVVLGCAHAGLENILAQVGRHWAGRPVHALVGGTHLGFAGEESFARALEAIEACGIQRIGVAHCTGPEVAARLRKELGEKVFFAAVGTEIEG